MSQYQPFNGQAFVRKCLASCALQPEFREDRDVQDSVDCGYSLDAPAVLPAGCRASISAKTDEWLLRETAP